MRAESKMTEVVEVWRPVPGFENDYECSTFGRCRSKSKSWAVGQSVRVTKPKMLKLWNNTYFRLRKGISVYRLTPAQCKSIASSGDADEG